MAAGRPGHGHGSETTGLRHLGREIPFSAEAVRPPSRAVVRYVVVPVLVVLVVLAALQWFRPISGPRFVSAEGSTARLPGTPPHLPWPVEGSAALAIQGLGRIGRSGTASPVPISGLVKVMTAYLVLRDHPIPAGALGPNIAVTSATLSAQAEEVASQQAVVPVLPGESLSEYAALAGILVASGNDLAVMLADWDAGSTSAFVAKMNATARQLGLPDTHYDDASGVTPGTVSTAAAQVQLAMDDMTMPAFRSVVAMPQATLPVAGIVYNVDAELGKDGIIGIKTGFTAQAGGCFVFAATTKVDGRTRTVVGAVLHQESTPTQPSPLTAAFDASAALITSADRAIEQQTVIHAGQVLGHLHAPWAPSVALRATRSVTFTGLAGDRVHSEVDVPATVTPPLAAGRHLGSAIVELGDQRMQVPLATTGRLPGASLGWRLTDV